MRRVVLLALGVTTSTWFLAGCAKEGCLQDDPGCRVKPPCPKVKLSCEDSLSSQLKIDTIDKAAQRPGGWDAIGTKGDVLLQNAFTQVVVAGIGNQTNLDPNGGSIIDLATPGQPNDALNQVLTVTGVLPDDAAFYTSLEIIDERPERVAVQVKGTLQNQPTVQIYTRYELTPCDRGVRSRTEIVNRGPDSLMWMLGDGFWWGNREPLPFAPGAGSGFKHPPFSLTLINDVVRTFPFMSANSHSDQSVSYSQVSCTDKTLEGFHSAVVSFAGVKRQVVPSRGYLTFDRYLAVAPGKSVAEATDLALEIRSQVLREKFVTLVGKVERMGALKVDSERETLVQISEGSEADSADKRIPWTSVVPNEKGVFSARVPAGKSYYVEVHSFGQKQAGRDFANLAEDTNLGVFTLPSTAQVTFEVKDDSLGPVDAEIFIVPADDAMKAKYAGSLLGQFTTCSPWLGPPPGASPACNRVLVRNGTATAEIPVGNFHVYAFHGPFWSLARQTVNFTPTTQTLKFTVKKLGLPLSGTLGADLHVHGAASFDSSIPDLDRVLSFAASDLEVIVATDHDVVYDYGELVKSLGLSARMTTITGVETTGHVPWLRIPNYGFPLVIGHYNFWPLRYDPLKTRNGGPMDEFVEPGVLMDRATELRDPVVAEPLIELNHPWAAAEFGRDLGFPRALSLDMRKDLPAADDGSSAGIYVRAKGSKHKNNDHHAQEVMNGSQNDAFSQYRAFWWYSLNQGQLKTGTANSDSHSLTDNTVGMPRNLVYAGTPVGPAFEINKFNDAIKAGRVLGTNGPIIEATVEGVTGEKTWSMEPFKPKDSAVVKVKVTSAPWVPVSEVRFVVNGKVVKTVIANAPAADPFGTTELLRYEGTVPLSELVSGVPGDAWLVIEAGTALAITGDLGGGLDGSPDGIPDTTDNNGDGKVDARDVPEGSKIGPLKNVEPYPASDVRYHFNQLTEGYPLAFTNPFILDRDGVPGFKAPGVNGGR